MQRDHIDLPMTDEEMNPTPEDWEIEDLIFAHDHEEPDTY